MNEEVSDELEVLRAIYDHDFEDRPPVWNYPSFAVKIKSSNISNNGNSILLKVTVRFKITSSYPKTVPKVEIETADGLSQEEQKELLKQVDATAQSMVNKVMCHEILSTIQAFLDRKNSIQQETLYETMVKRQQKNSDLIENIKKETKFQQNSNKIAIPIPMSKPIELAELQQYTQALNKAQKDKEILYTERTIHITESNTPKSLTFDAESTHEDDIDKKPSTLSLLYDNSKSRYFQEFIEMTILGGGASGKVWKVKHKLDRRIYAVKKIDLNSRNNAMSDKIQREVTTISRLIHKNIVRYYAAWMEQYEPRGSNESQNSQTNKSSKFKSNTSENSNYWDKNSVIKKSERELSKLHSAQEKDLQIYFEDSNSNSNEIGEGSDYDNDPVDGSYESDTQENSSFDFSNFGINNNVQNFSPYNFDSSGSESNSDEDSEMSDLFDEDESSSNQVLEASKLTKPSRWLFIQMEYCPSTLRDRIDDQKLWTNTPDIFRLLRQTLEALTYMHGRKVIHRDLKPANIFLDAEDNIKIGDFGLATTGGSTKSRVNQPDGKPEISYATALLADTHDSLINDMNGESNTSDLTAGVGTALYRAPEQEGSEENHKKNHLPYNEKADMYSLGIILFEMCHKPFNTGMERLLVIKDLRVKQHLSDEFKSYANDNLVKTIIWLTNLNPDLRPSASDLLYSDLLPKRADIDAQYLKDITDALHKPNSIASANVLMVLFQRDKKINSSNDRRQRQYSFDKPDDFPYQNISYDIETFQRIHNLIEPITIRPYRQSISKTSNNNAEALAAIVHRQDQVYLTLHSLNGLKKKLKYIFELHGAIELPTEIVQLRSSISSSLMQDNFDQEGGNVKNIVEYLDNTGHVVYLQPDLVSFYTRTVAYLNIQYSQRFSFDKIYYDATNDSIQITQPIHILTKNAQNPLAVDKAVYDIILPATLPSNEVQVDVDILLLVEEIIHELENYLPNTTVRISHSLITDTILTICTYDSIPLGTLPLDLHSVLIKILSFATDSNDFSEIELLMDQNNIPSKVKSRISPFIKILLNQDVTSQNHDPLLILDRLDEVFFLCEDIQQVINPHAEELPINDLKSTAPLSSNSQHNLKSKAQSLDEKNQAKVKDFTPINLSSIGIKSAIKKQEKNMSASFNQENINLLIEKQKKASTLDEQSKRVKNWISTFQRGVNHLKEVIQQVLHRRIVFLKSKQCSNPSDLFSISGTSKDNFPLRNIIIDLGINSISTPRILNPYRSPGFKLIVESFSLVQKENHHHHKNRVNTPDITFKHQESVDKGLGNNNLKRKKRKLNAILMEGGHFETSISAQPRNFKLDTFQSEPAHVFACGLCLHLENILSLLVKAHQRSKLVNPMNSSTENLKFFQVLNQMDQLQVLVLSSSSLAITDSKTDSQTHSTAIKPSQNQIPSSYNHKDIELGYSYNTLDLSVSTVVQYLKAHGIRASSFLHQLQGFSPGPATELCRKLLIPIIIFVETDKEGSHEIFVQNIEDTSSNPHLLPFKDLLSWVKNILKDNQIKANTPNKIPATLSVVEPSKLSMTNLATSSNKKPIVEEGKMVLLVILPQLLLDIAHGNENLLHKKKKKELDYVINRVSSLLPVVFHFSSTERLNLKLSQDFHFNKIFPQGFHPLTNHDMVILGLELPLTPIRLLNSAIMSRLHGAHGSVSSANLHMFKSEWDNILSSDLSSQQRKVLKHLLSTLINYSSILLKELSNKSSGSSSPHNPKRAVLHLYSIPDDLFDTLFFQPELLSSLRI